jgi:Rieske Fe-S protein
MADRALDRRTVLRGALVAVLGGVAGYLVTRNSTAAKAKAGTTAANAYGASGSKSGQLLASLDRVPIGGGLILDKEAIVLVRSSAEAVQAFSAVCTHQGCTVDKVSADTIDCPCHATIFDAHTGKVISGPANRALPSIAVTIRAGSVYRS